MKTSAQKFTDALENQFSTLPLNSELMKDVNYYKSEFQEEKLIGGLSDNKTLMDIAKKHNKKGHYDIKDMISLLKKELKKGIGVEMEHTKDRKKAKEIAMDHLSEDPKYYVKLRKIESKEATGASSAGSYSGKIAFADSEFLRNSQAEMKKMEPKEATSTSSSGQYSSPAFVAPNKKEWRGAQKPLYKGGKFVKVKKKCLTFPYCNQGDINSLKLTEGGSLDEAIKSVSEKLSISEETIKNLLVYEIEKLNKTK